MIPYSNIIKQVALKSGQIGDRASASAFNTMFDGAINDLITGLEIPRAALKMAILASEARIAALVAKQKNPVLRTALYGKTGEILSGALLPNFDTNNVRFFGNFGNVLDFDNDHPLSEQPKQVVMRRIENANEFFILGAYYFCLEDSRIFHTRAAVYLEGCVWNRAAQLTAYDNANGTSPLHEELETFFIADVLANLPQEDWFVSEAETYRRIADKCETDLMRGVIPNVVLPSSTARAEPIKD